jgi:hypothetical protein
MTKSGVRTGIDRRLDLVCRLLLGKESVAMTDKVFPGHEILNVHSCQPRLFRQADRALGAQ